MRQTDADGWFIVFYTLTFFFSSRRRHTSCLSDWSSDVCSSDLFRYRDPIIDCQTLTVCISQSGETADTLAAQREAKLKGSPTVAICNVIGSMITREASGTIPTLAGPEIGVASTKAFSSQLAALLLLAS